MEIKDEVEDTVKWRIDVFIPSSVAAILRSRSLGVKRKRVVARSCTLSFEGVGALPVTRWQWHFFWLVSQRSVRWASMFIS